MNLKYKFCLHKAYFEKGYSLSHYILKLIAIIGLTSGDLNSTLWMASGYTIGCYFLGYFWYKFRMIDEEIEVGNRFNKFVKETRKFIKSK